LGGAVDVPIYWLEAFSLWIGFRDEPLGEEKPSLIKRFWVPFGIEDPTRNRALSITGEINSPHEGTYRKTGGLYARDDATDHVVVLHRGSMAGGRRGVSKTGFWRKWDGPTADVMEQAKSIKLAFIADLSSDHCLAQLADFAHRYATIKRALVAEAT
jgi:hypothetical protein